MNPWSVAPVVYNDPSNSSHTYSFDYCVKRLLLQPIGLVKVVPKKDPIGRGNKTFLFDIGKPIVTGFPNGTDISYIKAGGGTFCVQISCDVKVNAKDVERIELFKMPIMVGSYLDPIKREKWDSGVFYVKGQEKILIPQLDYAVGSLTIKCKKGVYQADARFSEKKSISIRVQKSPLMFIKSLEIKRKSAWVPITALLSSMGCLPVEFPCLEQKETVLEDPSILYDFLPAISDKKNYLKWIVKTLCVKAMKEETTDRDHFKEKIGHTPGELFSEVYRVVCEYIRKTIQVTVFSHLKTGIPLADARSYIQSVKATNLFAMHITNGEWKISDYANRTGVSQILNRMNMISFVSHMKKFCNPVSKDGKNANPRFFHPSQFFFVCPSETPDDEHNGLVLRLGLFTRFSVADTYMELLCSIKNYLSEEGDPIFLNRVMIGFCDCEKVATLLKYKKRCLELNPETSFNVTSTKELHVRTSAGRFLRPLLVVENGKLTLDESKNGLSFDELLEQGVLELVDIEEQERVYISMTPKDLTILHTHCEIDPISMFSENASVVVYSNKEPSTRINMTTTMASQAIGSYIPHKGPFDNKQYLMSPQKPLVFTKTEKLIGLEECPLGTNCVVLIHPWDGFDKDDSIALNQSSVDRGLFQNILVTSYEASEKKQGKRNMVIEKPEDRSGKYSRVGPSGIVAKGAVVRKGDFLMTKVYQNMEIVSDASNVKPSISLSNGKVSDVEDREYFGSRRVRVAVSTSQKPDINGDKFTTRQSQKGLVALMIPEEDMPFSNTDGSKADVIINPHSMPSRMTAGMLEEILNGKKSCLSGKRIDGSPFQNPEEWYKDLLTSWGYNNNGKEAFINGSTGKLFSAPMFQGLVYYYRLKHMAKEKIQYRDKGPINIYTRQPVEGKKRDGGLKLGEMETQAYLCHGGIQSLHEKLNDHSDKSELLTCHQCGKTAYLVMDHSTSKIRRIECERCGIIDDPARAETPHALKLLFMEMNSLYMDVKTK